MCQWIWLSLADAQPWCFQRAGCLRGSAGFIAAPGDRADEDTQSQYNGQHYQDIWLIVVHFPHFSDIFAIVCQHHRFGDLPSIKSFPYPVCEPVKDSSLCLNMTIPPDTPALCGEVPQKTIVCQQDNEIF